MITIIIIERRENRLKASNDDTVSRHLVELRFRYTTFDDLVDIFVPPAHQSPAFARDKPSKGDEFVWIMDHHRDVRAARFECRNHASLHHPAFPLDAGAELVITSKARFFKTIYEERLEAIRRFGIDIKDAFQGNSLSSIPKAIEVLAFLQNKCEIPCKSLVFDDNDDGFSGCPEFAFIQINPKTGLTPEEIEKGVRVLKG